MQILRKHGFVCTILVSGNGYSTLLVTQYESEPPEQPRLRAVRKRP